MLNFFNGFPPPFLSDDENENGDEDDISMTPDNTVFVEYLPAGCFGSHGMHNEDTIAVMNFVWEEKSSGQFNSYYQAKQPENMWRHTSIDAINDLIARI
jgi:hypothetical protein